MKTFAAAVVLILGAIAFAVPLDRTPAESAPRFMAFCADGDGPLSEWVSSRYEAFLDGREHERLNRNHRWEIWVQDGETTRRQSVCSRIKEGTKPETMVVENTCDKCVKFTVARTNADGSVNAKEFTMKPKTGRNFRILPNSKLTVDSERDCPE